MMKQLCFLFFLACLLSCVGGRYIETNLYFGQSKPDGSFISEAEWNNFKEKYISRVFKEGSSIVSVTGNWYDTSARKLITEQTYLLSYYYKKSKERSEQIDSLRYYYKQLFSQQSVLRVDRKVRASF